jgi:hypothetical protein
MKIKSFLSILFMAFLLSACGSSSTSSTSGTGGDATGVAALQGVWNTNCNASGGTSSYDQQVFSGVIYTKTRYIYSGNNTCSGTATTVSTLDSGTFSVEGSDNNVSGGWDTDLTESGTVTYDLFYVSGTTLQEGLKSGTYTETTSATRPVSLNSATYTKQ